MKGSETRSFRRQRVLELVEQSLHLSCAEIAVGQLDRLPASELRLRVGEELVRQIRSLPHLLRERGHAREPLQALAFPLAEAIRPPVQGERGLLRGGRDPLDRMLQRPAGRGLPLRLPANGPIYPGSCC